MPHPDFSSGQIGQRYFLDQRIGAGSEASVYSGREIIAPGVEWPRAFKVFSDSYPSDFYGQEAKALRQLKGEPHVLQVRDFGSFRIVSPAEQGERAVMVTDLAKCSLDRLMGEEAVGPERAVRLLGHAALGLAAAHGIGLIHRDLKPQNLLITHNGILQVGDFGVAKPAPRDSQHPSTGLFAGTLPYAAPEQLEGHARKRSDIFGLGVVAYKLFHEHNSLPFVVGDDNRANIIAWLRLHQAPDRFVPDFSDKPDPVQQKIHTAIKRALEVMPEKRYSTPLEFKRALEVALEHGLEIMRASRTIPENAPVAWPPEPPTYRFPTLPASPPRSPDRPRTPASGDHPVHRQSTPFTPKESPTRKEPRDELVAPRPIPKRPAPRTSPTPARSPNSFHAYGRRRSKLMRSTLSLILAFGGFETFVNFGSIERSFQLADEHNQESFKEALYDPNVFHSTEGLGDNADELMRALSIPGGPVVMGNSVIYNAMLESRNFKGLTEAAMTDKDTVTGLLGTLFKELDKYQGGNIGSEGSQILRYAAALELMNTQTASGHQEILTKLKGYAGNRATIPGTKVEFAMLDYFKLGKHDAATTKRYVQQLVHNKDYFMLEALTPQLEKIAPDVLESVVKTFTPKGASSEETDHIINILTQLSSKRGDIVKGFVKKLTDLGYLESLTTLGMRMAPVDVSVTEKIFHAVNAREVGGPRAQTLAITLSRARPQYVIKIREYATGGPNDWLEFASRPKVSAADCKQFVESQSGSGRLEPDFPRNAAAFEYAMRTGVHGIPWKLLP